MEGLAMALDVTRRCFETCVKRANTSLDDSERACIAQCASSVLSARMLMAGALSGVNRDSDAKSQGANTAITTNEHDTAQ